MIDFSCPQCGHALSASEDKGGAEAKCPGCGGTVRIPGTPLTVQTSGVAISSDERQWGMLCHISGLIAMAAGGMSFLGPLICWLIKKDTSGWVDYHGKEALNFHLNILGYTVIAVIVTFATCGIGAVALLFPLVYGIIMSIVAAIAANDGKRYEYPGIVRLVK